MNIFVTGGTGFVGSHFVQQALVAGHRVLAQRRATSSKPRIPLLHPPEWIDNDLQEGEAAALKQADALVHFAAHTVNPPYDRVDSCLQWNLIATLSLFEQARLAGIKRFLVAGSCFEYGRSGERYEAIPTNAPLEPTNSYAVSKAAASIALIQWAEEHKVELEILRIFHVYGEGEAETRLWPMLRKAALAGDDLPMTLGAQIRDFMPVEGVARLFLERLTSQASPAERQTVFNLSGGHPCSIKDFAEHWWRAFAATGELRIGAIPYRDREVMRYVAGPRMLEVH
jgi:nucleoside-diphosphate-sugar epimerase